MHMSRHSTPCHAHTHAHTMPMPMPMHCHASQNHATLAQSHVSTKQQYANVHIVIHTHSQTHSHKRTNKHTHTDTQTNGAKKLATVDIAAQRKHPAKHQHD